MGLHKMLGTEPGKPNVSVGAAAGANAKDIKSSPAEGAPKNDQKKIAGADAASAPANYDNKTNSVEASKQAQAKLKLELDLRTFADQGDKTKVEQLLNSAEFKAQCDINAVGAASLQTALHRSAQKSHTGVVSRLLEHKADITLQDLQCETAKDMAVRLRKQATVKLFDEYESKYYPVNIYNESLLTRLVASDFSNFQKIVRSLAINPNYKIKKTSRPLLLDFHDVETMEKLIFLLKDCGGNVNLRAPAESYYNTILHTKLISGLAGDAFKIAQLTAQFNGHRKLNPNLPDINGRTILMLAIAFDADDLLVFLLQHKEALNLNLEAQDKDGFTALHYASLFRKSRAAQLLLQAGASPARQDNQKRVPQQLLDEKNNDEVLRVSKSLHFKLERDSKAVTDTLEATFNFPILNKASIDKILKGKPLTQTRFREHKNVWGHLVFQDI